MKTQINECAQLLDTLELSQFRNSTISYSNDLPGQVRKLSYVDEWRHYVDSGTYDILLADQSLLQFKLSASPSEAYSFCYYECPLDILDYSSFVFEMFGVRVRVDDSTSEWWDFYEDYVDSAKLKPSVSPIRYDFSPDQYSECTHPYCHLHIGHSNQIRIALARFMEPLSFVYFVVRQLYPKQWASYISKPDTNNLNHRIRDSLISVDRVFAIGKNTWQLVLT